MLCLLLLSIVYIVLIVSSCACRCSCAHSCCNACVAVRGELGGVGYLLATAKPVWIHAGVHVLWTYSWWLKVLEFLERDNKKSVE